MSGARSTIHFRHLASRLPLDAAVADGGHRREPGFHVAPLEPAGQPERSRLVQTARFRSRGLLSLAYWCGVMP